MEGVVVAEDTPKVLLWHRIYCAVMVLIYLVSTAGGAAMMLFAHRIADAHNPAAQFIVQGFLMAALGSIFTAAFLASFFLPRAPWAWVYHIVLISLGMTSCCCLPACVPLLIFWLNPETQSYFGRTQAGYKPPSSDEPVYNQMQPVQEPEPPETEGQTGEQKIDRPEEESKEEANRPPSSEVS